MNSTLFLVIVTDESFLRHAGRIIARHVPDERNAALRFILEQAGAIDKLMLRG